MIYTHLCALLCRVGSSFWLLVRHWLPGAVKIERDRCLIEVYLFAMGRSGLIKMLRNMSCLIGKVFIECRKTTSKHFITIHNFMLLENVGNIFWDFSLHWVWAASRHVPDTFIRALQKLIRYSQKWDFLSLLLFRGNLTGVSPRDRKSRCCFAAG